MAGGPAKQNATPEPQDPEIEELRSLTVVKKVAEARHLTNCPSLIRLLYQRMSLPLPASNADTKRAAVKLAEIFVNIGKNARASILNGSISETHAYIAGGCEIVGVSHQADFDKRILMWREIVNADTISGYLSNLENYTGKRGRHQRALVWCHELRYSCSTSERRETELLEALRDALHQHLEDPDVARTLRAYPETKPIAVKAQTADDQSGRATSHEPQDLSGGENEGLPIVENLDGASSTFSEKPTPSALEPGDGQGAAKPSLTVAGSVIVRQPEQKKNDNGGRHVLLAGQAPTAVAAEAGSRIEPDLIINTRAWLLRLAQGKESDALLRGSFDQLSPEMAAIQAAVAQLVSSGLRVEIHTCYAPHPVRITSLSHFWTEMLCDLILFRPESQSGSRRWLIEETGKIRKKGTSQELVAVTAVWKTYIAVYCSRSGVAYDANSNYFEGLLQDAIAKAGSNYNLLFIYFEFILSLVSDERDLAEKVVENLRKYEVSLADAPPPMLERVETLIGRASSPAEVRSENLPSFQPELVIVGSGALCTYEFEAMRYTLTVADAAALLGRLYEGKSSRLPYVFRSGVRDFQASFEKLRQEIFALVSGCQILDQHEGLSWDVPTVAEWIVLAGCEENPFPWGSELPTERHANLDFYDRVVQRIRPVGSYRKGKSKTGAQDCCGNVHEIVKIGESRSLPEDFRLAGGCYQNAASMASCHVFRSLIYRRDSKKRGSKKQANIGLRLVRVRTADISLRWEAARSCMNSDRFKIVETMDLR